MRLLVSARDAGTAGHLWAILDEIDRSDDFEAAVYADDPAFEILKGRGSLVHRFPHPAATDLSHDGVGKLVAAADAIIWRERPDAILVGVSHCHEAGIDEAFLSVAKEQPRFAIQDYWGDVNRSLGATADLYFVLDEYAVGLTNSRHSVAAVACGSSKHRSYRAIDVPAVREATRAKLGLGGQSLFGYFGQSLTHLSGYADVVESMAAAIAGLEAGHALFYRPHPRESREEIEHTFGLLERSGLPVISAAAGRTEEWLAAADVVISCFSSCAYDAAFLNRVSPVPVSTSVYLLFEKSIVDYFESVTGLSVPPPVELGLTTCISSRAALSGALREAIEPARREQAWRLARERLPEPADTPCEILGHIRRRIALAKATAAGEASL